MVVQVSSKLGLIVTLGNSTIRIRFDDYLVSFLRDHDASTSVLIIGLWKFNGNGRYSARSAYNIQFHGSVQMDHCRTLWKAKITNRCKMFIWLMIQGRLPTAQIGLTT